MYITSLSSGGKAYCLNAQLNVQMFLLNLKPKWTQNELKMWLAECAYLPLRKETSFTNFTVKSTASAIRLLGNSYAFALKFLDSSCQDREKEKESWPNPTSCKQVNVIKCSLTSRLKKSSGPTQTIILASSITFFTLLPTSPLQRLQWVLR